MRFDHLVASVVPLLLAVPVVAQSTIDLYGDIEAKRAASIAKLRDSIQALKEVRNRSCAIGNRRDCDLAKLSEIELILLDFEWRYRRDKAVSSAVYDVKRKLDELGDVLEKGEEP